MQRPRRTSFIVSAVIFASFVGAAVDEHSYKPREPVKIVANKIGPFSNPSETYEYYSLPFCTPPGGIEDEEHRLGEVLAGDRKVNTPYDIRFQVHEQWRSLCHRSYNAEEIQMLLNAIDEDYYFELFVDDLPGWGFVGEVSDEDIIFGTTKQSRIFLFPHIHFDISYNDDKIISFNISTIRDERVDLTDKQQVDVEYSYSVAWHPTTETFEDRLRKSAGKHFLPVAEEVHWLSVVNSAVLVILLLAFVGVIFLRIVKNDFTKALRAGDDELLEEETGWKLLSGDVFRPPKYTSLLSALVGNGVQFLLLSGALLTLAAMGVLGHHHHHRGSIVSAALVLYCLTTFVGSYVSSRLYRQLRGRQWVWNVVLTSAMYPGPLFAIFAFLNTTAVVHSSTAALPFTTVFLLFCLYVIVGFPLAVLGGISGHRTGDYRPPCRPRKVPRQIPQVPLYRSQWVQLFLAGFLPFSAIAIELHYIVSSVWGHYVYTLYGLLFLAFVLLCIVSASIVVALTYFQLAAEDHRWWWRSFLSGGMVGVFIYIYCFFYYFNHSDMSGFLQTSFFFGYMLIVSFAAILGFGSIGFFAAYFLVHFMYNTVKSE